VGIIIPSLEFSRIGKVSIGWFWLHDVHNIYHTLHTCLSEVMQVGSIEECYHGLYDSAVDRVVGRKECIIYRILESVLV
jgi:hypothetical protein